MQHLQCCDEESSEEPVAPDAQTGYHLKSCCKVESAEDISPDKPVQERTASSDAEHTVDGVADSADNHDSAGMDVDYDDPGGGKVIHCAQGDASQPADRCRTTTT